MISILGFVVSGIYMLIAFGIAWLDKGGFFASSLALTIFALPWSFINENSNYLLSLFIVFNAVILYFISLGIERLLGKYAWIVLAVIIFAIIVYFFVT